MRVGIGDAFELDVPDTWDVVPREDAPGVDLVIPNHNVYVGVSRVPTLDVDLKITLENALPPDIPPDLPVTISEIEHPLGLPAAGAAFMAPGRSALCLVCAVRGAEDTALLSLTQGKGHDDVTSAFFALVQSVRFGPRQAEET